MANAGADQAARHRGAADHQDDSDHRDQESESAHHVVSLALA
jgi:hypothetical protein